MNVIRVDNLKDTDREVHCPRGGFVSYRALIASDGMGFSLHKTVIPAGDPQHWHYKRHKEACYCISGRGYLTDNATGQVHEILPGTIYVLDNHDDHQFVAITEVVLISVFNPPVTGQEVHDDDGSY